MTLDFSSKYSTQETPMKKTISKEDPFFYSMSIIFCVLTGLGSISLFSYLGNPQYISIISGFIMVTILAFIFYESKGDK